MIRAQPDVGIGVTGEPFLRDRAVPADRRRGDPLMYALSKAGDDGAIWIAATLLLCLRRRRSAGWALRALLWLGAESAFVNLGLKRIFRRPRPSTTRVHPSTFRVPTDTSFPSGHAASAALMAVQLADGGPSAIAWTLLAGGVGLSRIRLGVHHRSDVAGGFAVGAIVGLVARAFEPANDAGRS